MFWDVFPTYLSIGMTTEEYWNGDPYLAVSFRKCAMLTQEKENGDAWWQGSYIREAVLSAVSAIFSFGEKKPIPYPKEPYRITPPTKKEKEEAQKREREKAIRSLNAWKDSWDRKHGK